MKHLVSALALAFVFPIVHFPTTSDNALINEDYQFQVVADTPEYRAAAQYHRDEFRRVVKDNIAMWSR